MTDPKSCRRFSRYEHLRRVSNDDSKAWSTTNSEARCSFLVAHSLPATSPPVNSSPSRASRRALCLPFFIAHVLDSVMLVPFIRPQYAGLHLFSGQIYGALEKTSAESPTSLRESHPHPPAHPRFGSCPHPILTTSKLNPTNSAISITARHPLSILPGHIYAGIKFLSTTKRFFVDRFPLFLIPTARLITDAQHSDLSRTAILMAGIFKPFRNTFAAIETFFANCPPSTSSIPCLTLANSTCATNGSSASSALYRLTRQTISLATSKSRNSGRKEVQLATPERTRSASRGSARYAAERFQLAYKKWLAAGATDGNLGPVFGIRFKTSADWVPHANCFPIGMTFSYAGRPDYRRRPQPKFYIEFYVGHLSSISGRQLIEPGVYVPYGSNRAAKTGPWPGATPFWPTDPPKSLSGFGGRTRPQFPAALTLLAAHPPIRLPAT